ncbi:MAG TPA: molybdopterin-binding protein, partial [Nitrospiria bacterium]|nr:molybdopterin-binding protein [Nitrospiria bacterium]
MEKTAGILIIGNEILSGKVKDDNSPYLCRELRSLGVDVKRLVVLPDDEEVIAEQVRSWVGQYSLIFTCGGVGPTHDDVTVAGIARGLGKDVIRDASLLALIQDIHPPPLTEA